MSCIRKGLSRQKKLHGKMDQLEMRVKPDSLQQSAFALSRRSGANRCNARVRIFLPENQILYAIQHILSGMLSSAAIYSVIL